MVAAVKKPKTEKVTIGSVIDAMYTVREQKRVLEDQVKERSEEYEVLETQLIELMKAEGVEKSSGKTASAGITTSVKPSVTDWDAFYAYIFKNKFTHLLERRPSVTACRELFETKGKIPGVEPFTKTTINLRNL